MILPRKPLLFLACGLVLACILIGLPAPVPVRADVGVQPVLPGGSSIKPGEETPIQMAAETVVMTVRAATESDNTLVTLAPDSYGLQAQPVWFPGIAEVEADFRMNNPTGESVSMTAWFPLASALENADWNFNPREIVSRIESFQVSVDGNPLDYAVSELPNPKGADKPLLPWASFPVTFPGGKETVIHVSYLLPLQPSVKGYEMALYYVFQTGAGWAGSIGQAELIVNLPYPASAETMAGMRKLVLPPMNVGQISAGVPSGAVLEGNQARWTWKDFEPGPEDDFAIWLLRPGKWQELDTARAAVKVNPENGQAWLDLASVYHSLSINWYSVPLLFSPFYIPPGFDAYQKAADLLPDHPAARAGRALFTLLPYLADKNAPPEVIQYVQDEYQIAKELDARDPSLLQEAGVSGWSLGSLEEAFYRYFYNDATATMEAATQAVYNATYTAQATMEYATRTAAWSAKATFMACYATAGADWKRCNVTPSPTVTLTPVPTLTSTPTFSATPQSVPTTSLGQGQKIALIVAAGIIVLVVVGYLAIKRLWKRAGK